VIKDTTGHSLAIYIPKPMQSLRPIMRLNKLAKVKDRSVNYLICDAIIQYLEREEKVT